MRLSVLLAGVIVIGLSGCMERLFYQPTRGPTPAPSQWPGAEVVRFASADGTSLTGWFIPATARRYESCTPTIIHVHGNAGNMTDHVYFTEFLPSAGFNLFLFDYRGYGESEGSATRREQLIADTHAALDAVLSREDVCPDRLGMYGHSLGGALGLVVMAERTEIRAAVIDSAFSSWRDEAASVVGGQDPGPIARVLARWLIGDAHRPDEAIARIDRPILLMHGDADTIIPVSHGRRLVESGGDNVAFIEVPGGEHNMLRESHPPFDRDVITFFAENLVGE